MIKKDIEKIIRKRIKKEYPEFSDVFHILKKKNLYTPNEFKKAKMKPIGRKIYGLLCSENILNQNMVK